MYIMRHGACFYKYTCYIEESQENIHGYFQKYNFLTIVKVNARSFCEPYAFTMTNSNCAFSLTN